MRITKNKDIALPGTVAQEANSECATVKVTLSLTMEQAKAVSEALDLYSRVGTGQVGLIAELARDDFLKFRPEANYCKDERSRRLNTIDSLLNETARALGYAGTHHSMGISHREVPVSARRAYEIQKALDRALAMERNPKLGCSTVDYDGLVVRYTQDPAPTVAVTGALSEHSELGNNHRNHSHDAF